jgi:hypothetical protein
LKGSLKYHSIEALHFSGSNGHHQIDRDTHETAGVLSTKIVRRKTDENLR